MHRRKAGLSRRRCRSAYLHSDAVAISEEAPRPATPGAHRAAPFEALAWFVAALAVSIAGFLATAASWPWFPGVSQRDWSPREFRLVRGSGSLDHNQLVVRADPGTGGALVTLETDFRSTDYRAIAWDATDVPDGVDLRLIWRTDYDPARLHSAPIAVAGGRPLPAHLAGNPNWVGRIGGLALSINGATPQPIRISRVSARTQGVVEVAGDRLDEWLAFGGFTGASINDGTRGAGGRPSPLLPLVATATGLAGLAWLGRARLSGRTAALPAVLGTLFVAAWVLLDAQWSWSLLRQVAATAQSYAGLDWRARHSAAEDAPLFQFIENVRKHLPPEPARVFVGADLPYFRSRAAYHLYPHNVFHDPNSNTIPEPSRMRPGDFFVVFQRRGVQYDAGAQRLRWDGREPVSAELVYAAPGGALFRIR
jgi:hypothetical protein